MRFFIGLFFLSLHLFAVHPEKYFQKTGLFQRSFIGVYIEDLETKEVLCSLNEDHLFVPASIQKVLVSYAALSLLGEDFCYQTDLQIEGSIDLNTQTLHGNVWIQGRGDPTLDLEIINTWADALKQKGIQKIEGKIIADVSCFDTMLSSPYWYFEDLGNGDGPAVSALNINRNVYELVLQPSEPLAKIVSMNPRIPYLTHFNEVFTETKKDAKTRIAIYGSDYSPFQFYRGSIANSKESVKVKGAISDPPLLCVSLLAEKISPSKGIDIVRYSQEQKTDRILINRHLSPPISQIIKQMNTHSINLYAEALVKTIGNGNTKRGIKKISDFYKNHGASFVLKDGSGLARTNYLSPKDYVGILKKIYKDPFYMKIYDSLAEPSMDGTLKKFPKIEGATLKAKTGSMSHIRSLAGYLNLTNGKQYAFCLICNHYPGGISDIKKAEEQFLKDFTTENLQK